MLIALKYGLYVIQKFAGSVAELLFRTLLLTPCNNLVLRARWNRINTAPVNNIQVLFQHGYRVRYNAHVCTNTNTADHYKNIWTISLHYLTAISSSLCALFFNLLIFPASVKLVPYTRRSFGKTTCDDAVWSWDSSILTILFRSFVLQVSFMRTKWFWYLSELIINREWIKGLYFLKLVSSQWNKRKRFQTNLRAWTNLHKRKRILFIFCVLSFLKSSVLIFSLYIMITFTDPSWKKTDCKDKSQTKTLGNL